MRLQEIKELNITQDLLDITPLECRYCNLPLNVNEVLTRYKCSNPYCRGHLRSRLLQFATVVGIVDVDVTAFVDLVDCTDFMAISDLFLEDKLDGFIRYAKDKPLLLKALTYLQENLDTIKEEINLESYIKCLGLPYASNFKISYTTSVELYRSLDSVLDLNSLCLAFGLKNKDVKLAIEMWISLLGYRKEVKVFELIKTRK